MRKLLVVLAAALLALGAMAAAAPYPAKSRRIIVPFPAGELLETATGADLTAVPYKGTPPALTDLMGGQIDFMFCDIGPALPLVMSGRLRAALADPAVRQEFANTGGRSRGSTADELRAFVNPEMAKWAAAVKTAGIQPE